MYEVRRAGEVRPGRGLRVYPASGCVVPARWASTCGTLRLVERQQRPSSPRIVHSARTVSLIPLPILPSLGPSTDRTRRRWVRAGVGRAGGCGFGTDGNDRPAPARLVLPCGADCTVTVGGSCSSLVTDPGQMPHVFSLVSVRRNITPGTSTMLAASCEGLCNWACGMWPAWRGRRLLCLTT